MIRRLTETIFRMVENMGKRYDSYRRGYKLGVESRPLTKALRAALKRAEDTADGLSRGWAESKASHDLIKANNDVLQRTIEALLAGNRGA